MSSRTESLSEAMHAYVLNRGVREAAALTKLREETRDIPMGGMQIAPEQGALMALLTELMGVRHYLEVGVFTGYSTLAVALAMPDDGQITALDLNEEWTAVARKHWRAAGVDHMIDLRLGDGVEGLKALLNEGYAASYDFAFIDAEKSDYDAYYEHCVQLVRPGGLIAIDNAFHGGRVVDPERATEGTAVIDALNAKIFADPRVTIVLLPIGDGLMLCRRRD
jgi:caffeoyl-CoA O-methyltransferase